MPCSTLPALSPCRPARPARAARAGQARWAALALVAGLCLTAAPGCRAAVPSPTVAAPVRLVASDSAADAAASAEAAAAHHHHRRWLAVPLAIGAGGLLAWWLVRLGRPQPPSVRPASRPPR
jgi:hypothetical protein